jgi:hypothetical protein
MKKSKKVTNSERLAIIETKLDDLNIHFTNHLHQHQAIIKGCLTLAGTAAISLMSWVAKILWNVGHSVK